MHALPEINARRPMVYIDCTFLYEGVMLRLTMQVLLKKKIEKKTQKNPRTRLPVEGNGFPVFVMAHLLTFSWHEKYQNR